MCPLRFSTRSVQLCRSRRLEIEGFRPEEPDASLYRRLETPVTLTDGRTELAWTYFYNAPLGSAPRIESGDYLDYLRVKR